MGGVVNEGAVPSRRVLVVSHTHERALQARRDLATHLAEQGMGVLYEDELGGSVPTDVEIAVVLGGDGTILRAAEVVRGSGVPVLGINLGHVGFLAELDEADIGAAARQIAHREYTVEHRMTLDVWIHSPEGEVQRTWAMNEASLEKGRDDRLVDVAIGIDGRALESFGCDGVLIATPTGSTAYAFSAGGPVVWPDVEALLVVPVAAHALFARPLVVGPDSVLDVEVLSRGGTSSSVWCDGRRVFTLAPGGRMHVRRGRERVSLARLRPGPFTARLVRKFDLPVVGWRGHGSSNRPGSDAGTSAAAGERSKA